MKRLHITDKGTSGTERFTRRFQNGVEILERETMRTIKVNGSEYANGPAGAPRLIIDDAIARTKMLITKSRSQMAEVDAFLRSILRRPMNAK